jgi:hypothetical protein
VLHQFLAVGVDIVDLIGEMAEVAAAGVEFGIPVVIEFNGCSSAV